MNRFEIVKCIDVKEDGYDGPSIVMSCVADPDFALFFPIAKDDAKMINYVLDKDNKYDINTNILGVYKTMLDSWRSSDKYLSGVIMDSVYDQELKDHILVVKLALADHNGDLDSLVNVNFLHAIILASMENINVVFTDALLDEMVPDDDDEDDEDDENEKPKRKAPHFPEDKKIVDLAKQIMSGKTKSEKKK